MKKLSLILGCMALLTMSHLHAQQGPKFTVEVSSDSVLMNNYFTVSFTLENADGMNFMPPSFEAFEVVSGPNTSTSMSMMNGEVSRKVTYTYYLRPRDIGNYYIEPASIESEEGVLETLPREVIILPNPDNIIQQPEPQNRTFQFDMGGFDWEPFFGPDFKMDGLDNLQQLFPSLEDLQNNMKGFFPDLEELKKQQEEGEKKKKRKVYKM